MAELPPSPPVVSPLSGAPVAVETVPIPNLSEASQIAVEEATALSPAALVAAAEAGQLPERMYTRIVGDRAKGYRPADAKALAGWRRSIGQQMDAYPQPADRDTDAYRALRFEAIAVDDTVAVMKRAQKEAFVREIGYDYGGFLHSHARRAWNAVREAPARAVVAARSELATRSTRSKLGLVALSGAAVGAFVATKDVHAAQAVTEHVVRHGHESLAHTGSHDVSHAHDVGPTVARHPVHPKHFQYRNVALDAADGDRPQTAARGYETAGFWHDVNIGAGWAAGLAVPAAALFIGWNVHRGNRHRAAEREERIEIVEEFRDARRESRRALMEVRPPAEATATAYLDVAKSPRPQKEVLVNAYMRALTTNNRLNTGRNMTDEQMVRHLHEFGVSVHETEISVSGGVFRYFPQGRDGFDTGVMKRYMDAWSAAPPAGAVVNEALMYGYFRGLGLNVRDGQITRAYNRATGRTEFYFNNQGLRERGPNKNIALRDILPATSGETAVVRGDRVASRLRDMTRQTPYPRDLLGNAARANAMHQLRSFGGGAPAGLLVNRARVRALPPTPANEALVNAYDGLIRTHVNTILGALPRNVNDDELEYLGLSGFVGRPVSGPNLRILAAQGQSPGDALVRVAAILRQWDRR